MQLLSGVLDRDINLGLTFEENTASFIDFDNSIIAYLFEAGSVSPITVCNVNLIARDDIVEDRESFFALLEAIPKADDVNITRNFAEIFIDDSPFDGKSVIIILS